MKRASQVINYIFHCSYIVFIVLFSGSFAIAAPKASFSCPSLSPHAGKVVINEVHSSDDWIELYIKDLNGASNIDLTGWQIRGEPQNSKSFTSTLCPDSTTCTINEGIFAIFASDASEDTIQTALGEGDLTSGTNLFVDSDIYFHNTLQEILLVDNNGLLVHYLRYTNNASSGNNWDWKECFDDYPKYTTDFLSTGNDVHICSLPDGEFDEAKWFSQCEDVTPGKSNQPDNTQPIHHFLISLPASPQSICATPQIAIRACADESCSALYTESLSASLSANKSISADDTTAVNFNAGIALVDLSEMVMQTVTYDLVNPSIPAAELTQCIGGNDSCQLVFDGSTAFSVENGTGTCPSLTTTVRAFQYDLENQQCSEIIGEQSVAIEFSYFSPATGSQPASFSGTGSSVTLNQGQQGMLSLNLGTANNLAMSYQDGGQVKVQISGASGQTTGADDFIATFYPEKIAISSSETDLVAGKPFDFSIVATCSDNSVAPNYVPVDPQFVVQRVDPYRNGANATFSLPADGIDIAVTGRSSASVVSMTQASYNAIYSEWGKFAVSLTDRNYYGKSLGPSELLLGPFRAQSLQVEVTHGEFADDNGFNYIGKPFTYAVLPALELSGRHYDGVTVLKNYPAQSKDVFEFVVEEQSGRNTDSSLYALADPVSANGVHRYQFNVMDEFSYVKPTSPVIPYSNGIRLVDNQGFTDSTGTDFTQSIIVQPEGAELRYARFYPSEGAGPVNSIIQPYFAMQYYSANGWVDNGLDNTTSISSLFVTSPTTSSADYTSPFTVDLDDGRDNLSSAVTVTIPAQTTGGIFANVSLSEAGYDNGRIYFVWDPNMPIWMKSNWGAGALTEPPPTPIVFGQYNANDRIISWRELN